MKHLFDGRTYQETVDRIGRLHLACSAEWGKMNVSQMICHCSDPLREALGLRPTGDVSSPLSRSLFKWVSFYILTKWAKGKFPTSPEYDQQIKGTPPTDFETDRMELLKLLSNIHQQPVWYRFHPHPFFGKLTRRETGLLIYKHLDHHLRQFGV